MDKLGLDPKKFKLVSQDDKKTVLQHKDGHTLTIAHNVLSHQMKSQLKAMGQSIKNVATPEQKQEIVAEDKKKMAKGGEVKHYVAGGAVGEGDTVDSDPSAASAKPIGASPGDISFADPNSITTDVPQEYQNEEDRQAAEMQQASKDYTGGAQSTAGLASKANEPAETAKPPSMDERQPAEAAPAQPGAPEAAPKAAPAAAPEPSPEQRAFDVGQREHNDMQQELQNFNKDLYMGHIEPKTVEDMFAKKDTLGKIGTIFGMLVSGMGSGMSHQKNMMLELMNQEIDRDLDAQKSSATNAQNFLKINNEAAVQHAQANNLNIDTKSKAYALSKAQMMAAAADKMAKDIDKMPEGPDKQKKLQTFAMMNQAIQGSTASLFTKAASNSAQLNLMGALPGGQGGQQDSESSLDQRIQYFRYTNPEMAKEMESRRVPGIPALAKIPVPDNVRQDLMAHEKLYNAASDLLNYSKTHTNLNPLSAEYNYGVSKALVTQQMVRDGLLGTVFRESEKPLLEKFVNENPAGALKMVYAEPKLKAIIESAMNQGNTTRKYYGLPPAQGAQQSQKSSTQSPQDAMAWAKANPKDPRAATILKQLGK
jgi:hypothetical protein